MKNYVLLLRSSKCVCEQVSGYYSGLSCTHSGALIIETQTTSRVNFSFILSPKSLQRLKVVTFPSHISVSLLQATVTETLCMIRTGFLWDFQRVTAAWMRTFERSLHSDVSHFSHCLNNFWKRPWRWETRKTRLSEWFMARHSAVWKCPRRKGAKLAKFVWDLQAGCEMIKVIKKNRWIPHWCFDLQATALWMRFFLCKLLECVWCSCCY